MVLVQRHTHKTVWRIEHKTWTIVKRKHAKEARVPPQVGPATQNKCNDTIAQHSFGVLMKFHTRVLIIITTAKPESSLWWQWIERATTTSHWLVCVSECQDYPTLQTKQRSEESHELLDNQKLHTGGHVQRLAQSVSGCVTTRQNRISQLVTKTHLNT